MEKSNLPVGQYQRYLTVIEFVVFFRYNFVMKEKKILFINFGGLGDEILFLPTILSVKKEFPDSKITLALEPRSKGITSLTNVIDETVYFCGY